MSSAALSDVLPAEALANVPPVGRLAELADRAEAIVRPQSSEEVGETLRWATAHSVGVLPLGSGERLQHASLGGRFIVLSMDRLEGFDIYEPADMTFTARAGTRMADVRDALAEHRQWLPFDPPSLDARTLGGLVATGESGPVATGYGELRSHVLGATLVCGDGRELRLGGRVVKNVAGFDLLRPVVGSRGRLGVITSVCLRTFPVPEVDRLLLFRAEDVAGLGAVSQAVRTAPVLPASVVLWAPARSLGGGAALVVRLHGALPTVDADQAALERHAGVSFEEVADPTALSLEVRDHAARGPVELRVSVYAARLFEALSAASDLLGDVAVAADAYGGSARLAVDEVGDEAIQPLCAAVERLGGALGVTRTGRLGEVAGWGSRPTEDELELAASLEKVFDPSGVFWPCRA